MIVNLGSGRNPLPHAVNLDLENGWDARQGEMPFVTGFVQAVTVSHLLMYLAEAEVARLLFAIRACVAYRDRADFVLRVTEDDTSSREAWHDAVSWWTPGSMRRVLNDASFRVNDVTAEETSWRDAGLIQTFHGDPPAVFHQEAVFP